MVVALHAFAAVSRFSYRFLNPSTILTWFIRIAIVWVVSLPVALRALQVLERFENAAPPAFFAFFLLLVIAKASLLVLLARALERVQCENGRTVQLQS